MESTHLSPGQRERFFPETGCVARDPFLAFLERYGLELCGYPLTDQVIEEGRAVQFFQCLALEEVEPGVVRPRPVCAELLSYRRRKRAEAERMPPTPGRRGEIGPPPFALTSLVGKLTTHPEQRYPARPLEDIHHLVIHHTAAGPDVDVETIALFHVHRLGWPGIGYHFVIGVDGQIAQTNGLMTASFHARQFNRSAVGIALAGDFEQGAPPTAQIEACAQLCAWLMEELRLPVDAIEGHRELVTTTCPGDHWLRGVAWKEDLVARVHRRLGQEPAPEEAPARGSADYITERTPERAEGPDEAPPEAELPAGPEPHTL